MKKIINKAAMLRGNAAATTLIVLGLLFLVGIGCGGSKDTKPVGPEYHGAWTGSDGSTITIRGDGSGDYKSGGTHVTGGNVGISEADNTLNITLLGMGPSLKIDKAPSGNQMTLDGILYKKN